MHYKQNIHTDGVSPSTCIGCDDADTPAAGVEGCCSPPVLVVAVPAVDSVRAAAAAVVAAAAAAVAAAAARACAASANS